MPANSLSHFPAELETWQRALDSPRGIRLTFGSKKEALHAKSRLYHARERQRRAMKESFPKDDPRHNKSYYDKLSISLIEIDNAFALEIRESGAIALALIQEL